VQFVFSGESGLKQTSDSFSPLAPVTLNGNIIIIIMICKVKYLKYLYKYLVNYFLLHIEHRIHEFLVEYRTEFFFRDFSVIGRVIQNVWKPFCSNDDLLSSIERSEMGIVIIFFNSGTRGWRRPQFYWIRDDFQVSYSTC